jgi:cellulose synthase/poly-beta-1,6-N-acetylglucosamine synthase-like glycosyltransferase
MTQFYEILLYLILLVIFNSFIGYPLVIFLLGQLKKKPQLPESKPSVTIMIAAYNEEKSIAQRIENIASIDYDLSKVELIIGSDQSSDSTNQILLEQQKKYHWLKIFLSDKRRGKAGILNELIKQAENEILVFTDANTQFHKNALKNLTHDFVDPSVGGVCGKLILLSDKKVIDEGVEESSYWRYETLIKTSEGKLGIAFAANGGIFAIRKSLFSLIPLDRAVTDDLYISLSVVEKGYKFTYSENAIAYENTGKDIKSEFDRKVRFSATNFQTLVRFHKLLLNKNILLGYAFFSHKITRWILPFLLILLLILNSFVYSNRAIYEILFLSQILFYCFALLGFVFSTLKIRIKMFSLPNFFVVSNIAVLKGFVRFINKKHSVIWNSTER